MWVQRADENFERGSVAWNIVSKFQPQAEEGLVEKNYGDSFEDTDLEGMLARRGVSLLSGLPPTRACARHSTARWSGATTSPRVSDPLSRRETSYAACGEPRLFVALRHYSATDRRGPAIRLGTSQTTLERRFGFIASLLAAASYIDETARLM